MDELRVDSARSVRTRISHVQSSMIRLIRATAATAVTASAIVITVGVTPVAASTCPDIRFIGVRGSGDAQDSHRGMGEQVDDVFDRLDGHEDLGHVEGVGLTYPAVGVATAFTTWMADPVYNAYSSSVEIGAAALTIEIENSLAECPSTPVVLGGHSQGAEVIDRTLGSHGPAFENVAGVVLFGDPTFMWDRPYNEGTFEHRNGLFGEVLGSVPDQAHWGKIASYCRKDDWICQGGSDPGMADLVDAARGEHSKYVDGETEQASRFLTDKIQYFRGQHPAVTIRDVPTPGE